MKLTKTFALAALVAGSLIAGGAALQAQDNTNTPPAGAPPGGPGLRGRPNLDQMAKDLGLTDDQKAKLGTIMEDQQAKIKALRADSSLSQEDKRAKAKEIRGEGEQAMIQSLQVMGQNPELARFLMNLSMMGDVGKDKTTWILNHNTTGLELLQAKPSQAATNAPAPAHN